MLPQKKTDSFRLEPVPDRHIEVKKSRGENGISEKRLYGFFCFFI